MGAWALLVCSYHAGIKLSLLDAPLRAGCSSQALTLWCPRQKVRRTAPSNSDSSLPPAAKRGHRPLTQKPKIPQGRPLPPNCRPRFGWYTPSARAIASNCAARAHNAACHRRQNEQVRVHFPSSTKHLLWFGPCLLLHYPLKHCEGRAYLGWSTVYIVRNFKQHSHTCLNCEATGKTRDLGSILVKGTLTPQIPTI